MKKRILITNDDGIEAPGIYHLWESLKDHYEVWIVAPSGERSGAGLSITIKKPIKMEKANWPYPHHEKVEAYQVDGTPADCTKLALSILMDRPPDMVISGINNDINAGRNVLYSGTVGAVIEGSLRSIPGIAVSCVKKEDCDYKKAKQIVPALADWLFNNPLPRGTFLNVNVPFHPETELKIKWSRQGQSYIIENPAPHDSEPAHFWLGGKNFVCDEHPENDIQHLSEGICSVVPIHVSELTDLKIFHSLKDRFEASFGQ